MRSRARVRTPTASRTSSAQSRHGFSESSPDGSQRAKPEFDDLRRVAEETSRPLSEIRSQVMSALNETDFTESEARRK